MNLDHPMVMGNQAREMRKIVAAVLCNATVLAIMMHIFFAGLSVVLAVRLC